MNDEIKEILEELASKSATYHTQMNSNAPYYNTDDYKASLLLDYITNLQDRNKFQEEMLRNIFNVLYNDDFSHVGKLQKINNILQGSDNVLDKLKEFWV